MLKKPVKCKREKKLIIKYILFLENVKFFLTQMKPLSAFRKLTELVM